MSDPASAAAIITALTSAYAASQAGKKPKIQEIKEAPVADDASRRIAAEREMQRRYANKGAASTALTGSNKLG
jgi:hypothetical protein